MVGTKISAESMTSTEDNKLAVRTDAKEVLGNFLKLVKELTGLDRWTLFQKRHDMYCAETDTWFSSQYGAGRWMVYTSSEIVAMAEEIYQRNHAAMSPSEYYIGIPRNAAVPAIWCLDLDEDHDAQPELQLIRMRHDGFRPLAVVSTSPKNKQIWLCIRDFTMNELNADDCVKWREMQNALISRYRGDTGSKGPSHLFRLPLPGLKNLKTISTSDWVKYKYDIGFRMAVVIQPEGPVCAPKRTVIESWLQTCRHHNVQSNHSRSLKIEYKDEVIAESVWQSWQKKRENAIRSGKFLRIDGSVDDSSVDISLMVCTLKWYALNGKNCDATCKAMHNLISCCIRQIDIDPERRYKKGNPLDYAVRTLKKAYDYTCQQLHHIKAYTAAQMLSDAYQMLEA